MIAKAGGLASLQTYGHQRRLLVSVEILFQFGGDFFKYVERLPRYDRWPGAGRAMPKTSHHGMKRVLLDEAPELRLIRRDLT